MIDNIEVFKQNSIRIKAGCGNIYIDPFKIDEAAHDAAYVFITHEHYDHFSPGDIEKVSNKETLLIVPEKMEKSAGKMSGTVGKIYKVRPATSHRIGDIEFETVPMYNILKPFHPRSAGWAGYNLHIDGKRIYIAGDIDKIKEAAAVKCDIALLPIGGFYTMNVKQAAELTKKICPEYVIPVHYGDIAGKPEDGKLFAEKVEKPVKTVLKIKF
jgi:L-ascorbate metabolism protein UlaG (beta-lactamase superfamily)